MSAQSKTPTAAVTATAVGVTPKSYAERNVNRSDPFTIRDGHYVGHDGFVVPRNFEEFYDRFPDYVAKWVRKHADRFASKEDLEDWTNDLLVHLMSLPDDSKFREIGKSDLVQTFDPERQYGANAARFWNYINLCLTNKFRNMRSKHLKDALRRPGSLQLDKESEGNNLGSVGDEYCHANSAFLQSAARTTEKLVFDRIRLKEFEDFVSPQEADVLILMEALQATRTHGDAARRLAITHAQFQRNLSRLRLLRTCFLNRLRVPRRRRAYRKCRQS
jgi:hypothetical protein